jgi:hypothetical protein
MYDPQSTVEHDGRIYVAPLASVPMVKYPIPVDVEGQYVRPNVIHFSVSIRQLIIYVIQVYDCVRLLRRPLSAFLTPA